MGKRKKRNLDTANAMSRIGKNIETIARNTDETNRNTVLNGIKRSLLQKQAFTELLPPQLPQTGIS